MPDDELFTTYTEVKPEWIDYNGHMNMGYYLVAFDHIATDRFYDSMNIGVAHKQALEKTTFTLGANFAVLCKKEDNLPKSFLSVFFCT